MAAINSTAPQPSSQSPLTTAKSLWQTLWDNITQPSAVLVDFGDRRRARLASATVGTVFLMFFAAFVSIPIEADKSIMLFTCVALAPCYLLTRTRFYNIGTAAAVGVVSVCILSFLGPGQDLKEADPLIILPWVILPILMASLLTRPNTLLIVCVAIIGAIILFRNYLAPSIVGTTFAGVIALILTLSVVIIVSSYVQEYYLFRPQLEALRKAGQQLEKKNSDLQAANKEMMDFTYIIAHDLRVPLVNLMEFNKELRFAIQELQPAVEAGLPVLEPAVRDSSQLALTVDVPEALHYVETSSERMQRLINEILKVARAGRRELSVERIALRSVVEEITASLEHRLKAQNIQLKISPMPTVEADAFILREALGNLLDNAVKYLDPARPGTIEVFSESDPEQTIIHVRDNGRGIAADDRNAIFLLFRRASNVEDTAGEGIGLPYIKSLIQRQGGRLWLESELGRGTTFSFSIPVGGGLIKS